MLKRILRHFKKNNGISLVEMGVVLASVAAIVVVTAGGISLVAKAKIGKINQQISDFSKAVEEFETRYGGLPGDIGNVSQISGAVAGNGNGSIDTTAEALHFWRHLSLTKLIKGSYDGSSTNVPGVGVPAGPITSSGYNVIDPSSISGLSTGALVIELAGFSSGANNLVILKPEDARSIDRAADDGNPETGTIRAVGSGTDCVDTGAYNVSNSTLSCRVRFIIRGSSANNDADDIATSGACSQMGATRESPSTSDSCPTGTFGKAMQTCRINDSGVGTWELTSLNCEPVTCSGGYKYSETRTLACINTMVPGAGAGVTQTCSKNGVWVTDSTSCVVDTTASCGTEDSTRIQACGWGQKGRILQTCTGGVWVTDQSDCATMTCSSSNLGEVDEDNAGSCTSVANHSGTIDLLCTQGVTSEQPTSIGSNCKPQYTGACTAGVTVDRDIGCSLGETGSHIQTCVDADTDYWTTLSDTCKPVTCDGENVGTSRIKQGAVCPDSKPGTVIETCLESTGTWQTSYDNCASNVCSGSLDTLGNVMWPTSDASTTANGTCVSGFVEDGGTPTRDCQANSTWSSSVTNPCVRAQCPAGTYSGAVWPQTYSNVSNVKGTCVWPNFEGTPLKDCGSDGSWSTSSSACRAVDLPVLSDLFLWFDANDFTTVHESASCDDYAEDGDEVLCWMDKSGNENNIFLGERTSLAVPVVDEPVYDVDGMNNKGAVLFDGTDDFMGSAASSLVNPASQLTIHFALDADNTSTARQSLIGFNGYTNGTLNTLHGLSTSDTTAVYGGSLEMYSTSKTGPQIISFVMGASLSSYYRNGALINTDSAYTPIEFDGTYAHSFYVGGWHNGNYVRFDGHIGEVIVYNSEHESSDLLSVGKYLGDKWGISYLPIEDNNLTVWLDADDINTLYQDSTCATPVTTNGQTVGCWQDKSSAGNNMLQTTGSRKPDYVTLDGTYGTGTGSLLFYYGSSDFMSAASVTLGSNITLLVAAQYNLTYPLFIEHGVNAGTHNGFYFFGKGQRPWVMRNNGVSYFLPAANDTDWVQAGRAVYGFSYDGAQGRYYLDGIDQGNVYNGAQTDNDITATLYLNSRAGSTLFGYGDFYELLIFDTPLSITERREVEVYLGEKWGVSIIPVVSTSPTLWLDASDLGTLFQISSCTTVPAFHSDPVGCVVDKSNNGYNAIQSISASYKPSYVIQGHADSINGNSVLSFDGSDDYLQGTAISNIITNSAYTSFAVFSADTNSAFASYLSDAVMSDTSGYFGTMLGNGTITAYNWDGSADYASKAFSLSQTYIVSQSHSAGDLNLYVNGTHESSSASGNTSVVSGSFLIGRPYSGAEKFDGKLGEIIVYNSVLSEEDRQLVEGYLAKKWGEYVADPLPVMSGVEFWLDASDPLGTGVEGVDGSKIGTWYDKGPNDLDMTQSGSDSLKPTIEVGAMGGKPAMHFDAGQYLAGDINALEYNGTFTFFSTFQLESSSPNVNTIFSNWRDGNDGPYMFDLNADTLIPTFNRNITPFSVDGSSAISYDLNNPHVFAAKWESSKVYLYIDNVLSNQVDIASADTATTTPIFIGGYGNASNAYTGSYQGYIGDIVMYERALTDMEISSMSEYYMAKYNIASTVSWAPDDIANQTLWFDASDSSTLFGNSDCSSSPNLGDGNNVGCWKDKSVNSYNAVKSAAAEQPSYEIDDLGGYPTVTFDGNDFLGLDNNAGLITKMGTMDENTFFIVFGTTDTDGTFFSGSDSSDASSEFAQRTQADQLPIRIGVIARENGSGLFGATETGASTNPATGVPMIYGYRASTATDGSGHRSITYVNGVKGSGDSTRVSYSDVNDISDINMGRNKDNGASGQWYYTGDISEMLLYERDLTDAEINTIELYLSHKWGIAISN